MTLEPAQPITADELIGDDPAAAAHPAPPPEPTAPPAAAPDPEPAPEPVNPFAGVKDSRGVEFHPAKFRIKDGRPQIDSLGRFVPLGLGKTGKPEPTGAPPPSSGSQLPPDEPPPPPPDITAEISVEVAINLVQTALIVIGEEEGILDELETRMLRGPLLRVLEKYNLKSKMTPEMETAAIVATLIMRRLKKPKTQNWFQARLSWLRSWWIARKVKKAVPDPINIAPAHGTI